MNGEAVITKLTASLPELRGKLKAEAALSELTWFRAGGPAEVLYSPAEEADLAQFPGQLAVKVALAVVLLDVREDLALGELARRLADQLLLVAVGEVHL